jgi:hypothetical protein
MKVNKDQIEALYAFTRKHFVEWYDVQTEIVDHLANGIENQWKEKPNLTFDEGLRKEFKKFGVFGFSELVDQKTNALNKYYRKEVWKCFKDYFKLPKILITMFSVWVIFKIFQIFDNKEYLAVFLIAGVLCFYFIYFLKVEKQINNKEKQTGKKWLFESVIKQLGGFIHFLNIGIYMPLINFDSEWDLLAQWIFSGCIVVYILLFYISAKIVSPKLREKFSKDYPEYKLL